MCVSRCWGKNEKTIRLKKKSHGIMMDLDEDEGYQLFAKPAERRPAWVFWCSTDFSEEGGSFNSPKLWGKR